jgi:hypothetical protein
VHTKWQICDIYLSEEEAPLLCRSEDSWSGLGTLWPALGSLVDQTCPAKRLQRSRSLCNSTLRSIPILKERERRDLLGQLPS